MAFRYRGRSREVLTKFATHTVTKHAEGRVKEAAEYALSMAVRLSPFASGTFIASWRIGLHVKDGSEARPGQRGSRETALYEAYAASSAAIASYKLGDALVLSNSVKYAGFIEYGSPTTEPHYITKRVKASVRLRYRGVG